MKIAIVSSTAIETPPSTYGGLEWVTYLLGKGLAELGQQTIIIASKGSRAPEGCSLIETVEVGKSEEEAYKTYKGFLDQFDIIHTHSWQKWEYMAKVENNKLKIISTTHSQCPYQRVPPVQYPNFCAVSNAHAQYMSNKLGIPVRFVHNGIDLSLYPFQAEKGERYLTVNRIMAEKGIHIFVDLMRRLRVKGDIVGEDRYLITDLTYPTRIQNACDGLLCRYWGRVSHEQKLKLLQNAKALICLPQWPYVEVFGLSSLEALACGTPVITLRSGGLAEIVEDGKSGFICDTTEQIEQIIKEDKVRDLNPQNCRKRAEQFTYQTMASKYLSFYTDIISGKEW